MYAEVVIIHSIIYTVYIVEPEEPSSCDIPRKRVCAAAPGDNRPFLDLEKMQDEVQNLILMDRTHLTKLLPYFLKIFFSLYLIIVVNTSSLGWFRSIFWFV